MARKIKGGGAAVQDAEALRARKTTWKHDILMNWRFYLLFAPVFVYFIIFNYVPMGGIVMAFQDYRPAKGILGSEWIGLENFIEFFVYNLTIVVRLIQFHDFYWYFHKLNLYQ